MTLNNREDEVTKMVENGFSFKRLLVSVQRSLEIKTRFSIRHAPLNATEFTLIILIVDLSIQRQAIIELRCRSHRSWQLEWLHFCDLAILVLLERNLGTGCSIAMFPPLLAIEKVVRFGEFLLEDEDVLLCCPAPPSQCLLSPVFYPYRNTFNNSGFIKLAIAA
ncbi:hypothetical protein MUG91_G76n74 [Manis pentadactyla]|nr:hypothetical protein MUG91_G76n74 [Manis pentadactyla]